MGLRAAICPSGGVGMEMGTVALVMPMAGRGSRFACNDVAVPKPLVELWNRPFFWWAAESAVREFNIVEMVFVVLSDHVQEFAIDRRIAHFYPSAKIVVTPEVTSGAAETARLGISELDHRGPIIVNDSDHAFTISAGRLLTSKLENGSAGALLTFQSRDPAYSYVRLDPKGHVTGTIEKQVISDHAIAGGYLFASPAEYLNAYAGYEENCPYNEVFVSGLYNRLIGRQRPVSLAILDQHISFGTPNEFRALGSSPSRPWADWL